MESLKHLINSQCSLKKRKIKSLLLVLALLLNSCASIDIPKFKAHITLPASGDGYGVNVVTGEKVRYKKEEWENIKKRGIVLLSEDYKILKFSIQKNCQTHQCKELVGAFDELFLTIDKALQVVPKQ